MGDEKSNTDKIFVNYSFSFFFFSLVPSLSFATSQVCFFRYVEVDNDYHMNYSIAEQLLYFGPFTVCYFLSVTPRIVSLLPGIAMLPFVQAVRISRQGAQSKFEGLLYLGIHFAMCPLYDERIIVGKCDQCSFSYLFIQEQTILYSSRLYCHSI